MRAYEIRDAFGLDHLTLGERPDVEPGPGQVLLGMRAMSLNYRDGLMAAGTYDPRQPLPLVPLSDGVGRVLAVGPGVQRVKVGDRVCPIFAQRWLAGRPDRDALRSTLGGPLDGTLRERMVLSEEGVVAVPEHLSDAEAATLPCAGVTAWTALVTEGGVTAGQTVLVLGTGGVSVFALQLAKLLGARAVATTSSDEKAEHLRALGADEVVNYRAVPEWGKAIGRATGGVDLVLEVGGAGTLPQSLLAVRPGGTIALLGNLAGGTAQGLDLFRIFMRAVRVQGILVGHRQSFEALCRAVAVHRLQPVVDRVFPFGEAAAAFAHLKSGAHFGKVCIGLDD
jgi:NADPH:quinone reductase-like Zn-dependent oxidoreductase